MITLITEPEDYSPRAIEAYRRLGEVHFLPDLTSSQKVRVMKSADILVVRLGHQIDKKWLNKMPKLKVIATNTTGLNHIDVDSARKRGIKIISLRGRTGFLKNITATAELTLSLMLALVRKIPWAFENVKAGRWVRDQFRGHQLVGKTFGVLGFGRLGKIVTRYVKALGMSVIAHDPYVSPRLMRQRGVKNVSLTDLFKKSDVLSIHVLLTAETTGLVKLRHFKLMKPTAYLINTARGEIIERNALYRALKKKYIAGAGIDVMWDERADGSHLKNDPLWRYAKTHQNLIIVPHTGGAAYEAMQITEEFIADLCHRHITKSRL